MPVATDEELRDEILLRYDGPTRQAKIVFEIMPKNVLRALIGLLEKITSRGAVDMNRCSACGDFHGKANWNYHFNVRMLDRAKQVYAGIWIEKCRHGKIVAL